MLKTILNQTYLTTLEKVSKLITKSFAAGLWSNSCAIVGSDWKTQIKRKSTLQEETTYYLRLASKTRIRFTDMASDMKPKLSFCKICHFLEIIKMAKKYELEHSSRRRIILRAFRYRKYCNFAAGSLVTNVELSLQNGFFKDADTNLHCLYALA